MLGDSQEALDALDTAFAGMAEIIEKAKEAK